MKISPEARGYIVDLAQAAVNGMAEHAMKTLVNRPIQRRTFTAEPAPRFEPIYRPSSGCPWCDVSDFLALADKNALALRVVPPDLRPYFVKLIRQHLDAALGMIAVTNIPQLRELRTPTLYVGAELSNPIVAEQGMVATVLGPLQRMIEACMIMSVTMPNQMPAHLDVDFLITGKVQAQGESNGHDHQPINASYITGGNAHGVGVRDTRTDQTS